MRPNVQFEEAFGVVTIFLNRPHRLNAVNADLVDDLLAALEQANRPHVRAVVLAGRGRAFCAGHDLKEDLSLEQPQETSRRLGRLQDVTRKIRALDVPVVAAVHGHAIGAGAEFALSCDLLVAARGTSFRFPEVSLGLSVTNAATRLLPAMVGLTRAKQLVMLGEAFDADAAHGMGLVNVVVPPGDALPTAQRWAGQLAGQPQTALALAKQALNKGLDSDVAIALDLEVAHALETTRSGERA